MVVKGVWLWEWLWRSSAVLHSVGEGTLFLLHRRRESTWITASSLFRK